MLPDLFVAVKETVMSFSADPQWHLEGQPGFMLILHTWSQTLIDHFHIRCLIPGGVLSFDKTRWHQSGVKFLFRVESYAKKPFTGPKQVLEYLGRYTHRVAIANQRIRDISSGTVTFTYKDRQNGNIPRQMTLAATEFIRRFLLHVLPWGFMKIRYYGFLANTNKKKAVLLIRRLIGVAATITRREKETLRRYFLYDRKLLSELSRCGWKALKAFYTTGVRDSKAVPGADDYLADPDYPGKANF